MTPTVIVVDVGALLRLDLLDRPKREVLAHAIAREDRALLLDVANHAVLCGDGRPQWLPIRDALEAVEEGRAATLAVEVADDVLALDADTLAGAEAIRMLAAELRSAGLRPVVVASGQPGHLHLFARLPDRGTRDAFAERARTLHLPGNGVRHGRYQAIRPPGAPHRQGRPTYLLEPATFREVLEALVPCVAESAGSPTTEFPDVGDLSANMHALLTTGRNPARGYDSDSERLQAIATSLVNAGYRQADAVRLLPALIDQPGARRLRKEHDGADRRRRSGTEAAVRYLALCLRKAEDLVAKRPAIRAASDDLRAVLDRLEAAARAHRWRGRAGATDYAVLLACVDIARRAGKLALALAQRTVAERAGVRAATVVVSRRRLVSAGWLRRVARGISGQADVWELRIPGPPNVPIPPPQGGREKIGTVHAPSQDLWRWGSGLGKSALRVYDLLDPRRSQTTEQLATRAGRPDRNGRRDLRRQLSRLANVGLAGRRPDGWQRGPANVTDLIKGTRAEGAARRQRGQHEREREAFRTNLIRQRQVACTLAGRVLQVPVVTSAESPDACPRAAAALRSSTGRGRAA